MIEVEMKFALSQDVDLEKKLEAAGFCFNKAVREIDIYYDHIGYDVKAHDKALRIRRTIADGEEKTSIAYKGPKLDNVSMTREEQEMELCDGEKMDAILTGMGFVRMEPVDKSRKYYKNADITACLDEVKGLGAFLELEILVETQEQYDAALQKIKGQAKELGLDMKNTTQTSYLSMLICK